MPDLIHAADVFVHPSHMEGLCSTLIEVMLAGRILDDHNGRRNPGLWSAERLGAETVAPVAWGHAAA